MSQRVVRWAWINAAVMMLVLLMGALVTKTGSGEGCGRSWPMCHGNLVPDPTMESYVEYSHRLVSGIAGLIVFGIWLWARKHLGGKSDWAYRVPLWAAHVALFFTFIQAILGAMAVKWPQSPPILALHFGFSLIAVAATVICARGIQMLQQGKRDQEAGPDRRLRWWLFSIMIFTYGVVYLGALVRHTKATNACSGWPTCNGLWLPDESWDQKTWIAFEHRLAAAWLFAFFVIFWMITKAMRLSEQLMKESKQLIVLCLLQVVSGASIVWTIGNGPMELITSTIHILILSVLFTIMTITCIRLFVPDQGGIDRV